VKRKIVFSVIIALVLIVSGVTAVSAYESHLINVQAHVENALWVNGEVFNSTYGAYTAPVNFGTIFPELSRELDVEVGLSNSFVAQYTTGWSTVKFNLYWEPKPAGGTSVVPPWVFGGTTYYQPIWPYMEVDWGGSTLQAPPSNLPAAAVNATTPIPIATSLSLYATGHEQDSLHFIFNAPVFDYWYNKSTDPITNPIVLSYNSGSGYVINMETVTCSGTATYTVPVPNVDLGNNLKIQVIGFIPHG